MEIGGGSREEDEARRREAALAATPLFQACYKSSKLSQAQLDKFRELHERRLEMKEKSSGKRKSKVGTYNNWKEQKKEVHDNECGGNKSASMPSDPNVPAPTNVFFRSPDEAAQKEVPRKRKKLYWGLDTRERWERKSNM